MNDRIQTANDSIQLTPATTPPIPSQPPTIVRHLVLAALLTITAINYLQRNAIGAAETTIRESLQLTRNETGDAIAGFFLGYTLFMIPAGWLAQRWGPRIALSVFAASWSLATALIGLSTGWYGLYASRFLLGVLQAGVFSCATLVVAAWYPVSLRGTASALLNSFMLAGGAVGSALTGWLIGPLGWERVFFLYALPGIAWAAWFAWWFRDRPEDHSAVNQAEIDLIQAGRGSTPPATPSGPQVTRVWLVLLCSLPFWMLCVQQLFRAGANRFFDSYLPTYLQESRGVDIAEAGVLASLPQWAGVIGGFVGGVLSDLILASTRSRRLARRGLAVFSLTACILLYLAAYPIANVWLAAIVMSVGFFLFTFSSPCSYALCLDIGGRNLALVFSVMNAAGNLGAYAFTKVMPRLVTWWSPSKAEPDWTLALAVFAGMHVVALVCWLFLDPEREVGG